MYYEEGVTALNYEVYYEKCVTALLLYYEEGVTALLAPMACCNESAMK